MKCKIREIAIFGKNKEKRGVTFSDGLNIITGVSQTGKSALIEIVDYCLLSSTSTIPRGKIIEFADIFAIVLEIDKKYIVVGRPSPESSDYSKFYFKVEVLENMIDDIQKSYFDSINLITRDTLRREFGRFFGYDVSEISTEQGTVKSKQGMASFRNMTPFLFQHQSLIANKHALFYRFDDREKQERIIDEFPIFMGWVDGEYYRIKRELDSKERKLRFLKNEMDEISKNKDRLKVKIEQHLKDYYRIIGRDFPTISDISDLIKTARSLPGFDDKSYIISEYENKIIELEQEREHLVDNKQRINKQIELLEIASKDARSLNSDLSQLVERSKTPSNREQYICPLCEQEVKSLNEQVEAVKKSRIALIEDLKKIKNYAIDNSTTIERLKKDRDLLNEKIFTINGEVNLLKRESASELENLTLKERANEIKQIIEISIDITFGDSNILLSDQEIVELSNEIDSIRKELEKYDYTQYRIKFEKNLAKDMNKICEKMDFEYELRPPQLNFDSKKFIFSHTLPSGKTISLSEMGSGANWLACHLSLFLGLQKQFAANKKCSVPSFIFLDQPSQVYFPTDSDFMEAEKEGDIQKVSQVYDIILETLNKINQESGFLPQVIVTDHADNLPLKNGVFNDYVRKRWREGKKLI